MSCKNEPVIQSCDTGQQVTLFWQLSIDHNMDVQYQVKHRLYAALDSKLVSASLFTSANMRGQMDEQFCHNLNFLDA